MIFLMKLAAVDKMLYYRIHEKLVQQNFVGVNWAT
jgi:hypothetical protein